MDIFPLYLTALWKALRCWALYK